MNNREVTLITVEKQIDLNQLTGKSAGSLYRCLYGGWAKTRYPSGIWGHPQSARGIDILPHRAY